MRGILLLAAHELKRTLTDRGATAWMLLMPVVFATFFGLVMGGQSTPSDARASLSVLDRDGGEVAAALLTALQSSKLAITRLDPEALPPPEERVRTLVIPAGFSADVLAGTQATLRLEKEPDTNVEAALLVQARLVVAVARVLARLTEAGDDRPPSEVLMDLDGSGDLVRVDASFAGASQTVPSGFTQSIPGMAVMFVLLVALTYGSAAVSGDRAGGQLRRLVTTPLSSRQIVAGKIAGRLVVSATQVAVLVAFAVAASLLLGVPIGDHPVSMLVVLLVYTAAVAPLGVLLGAAIRDPGRAANVGVIVTMVMAAFGGCWWPLEVVSPTFQRLALVFPTGWAMRALHGVISFGHTLGGVAVPMVVLAAFGALFSAVAFRALRVT